MTHDRKFWEQVEEGSLAPWGQRVVRTAGRAHAEEEHPLRTAYQRDRSRVVHSRAFRRLDGKTQVFGSGTGDHLRTRLTHTMEVASVTRSIAAALGLNVDLAEVVALAHDLGHAPFGHAGEEALNQVMSEAGGFEHNLQSLRVVDQLERLRPGFPGLNLSWEVIEGLGKHGQSFDRPAFRNYPAETFPVPCLESQVANLADEVTYYAHDLEDGLSRNLITPEQLEDVPLWKELLAEAKSEGIRDLKDPIGIKFVVSRMIDRQVGDVVSSTRSNLEAGGIENCDAARRSGQAFVGYSEKQAEKNRTLRRFLYDKLYHHPEVALANERGRAMIRYVFQQYLDDPTMLGEWTASRLEEEGPHRTACDYVAGMTDRFLAQEYLRLGGSPMEKVPADLLS